MRVVVLVLVFCVSVLMPALAAPQDYSRLFSDFRSDSLTSADKRFLQAALAFEGHYNGLLDGDWGPISRRAMNAYAWKNFDEPAADWHQAMLALSLFQRVLDDGWTIRHLDTLGVSILVPADAIAEGEPSDTFMNFNHTNSSLSYSLAVEDRDATQRFHDYTENFNDVLEPPYSVRKQNFAVTSSRDARGRTLYTRSNFVRGQWSTIMLSAEAKDGNVLGAVTSSMAVGRAPPVMFTENGDLHRAVREVLALIDEEEGNDSVEKAPVTVAEAKPPSADEKRGGGSGTGFFVSEAGHVLTNAHVVESCTNVLINQRDAEVIGVSDAFDLAILLVPFGKLQTFARFANGPAKLNADVTVAGFPYSGILGGLNVTRGSVSSLKGLGGNALQMQITAPVQSGNSGGPVIASDGTVVGVVVAKLDAELVSDAIGDVPQNVNFAVRGEIAKLFLSQNGVQPALGESGGALEPTTLAERASAFTVFVECQ